MAMPVWSSASWLTQSVDDPKNFKHTAIVLENTTYYPHISYGKDHLYHAYFNGSTWQYETVDYSFGVGTYSSIAVDSNNKFHISYYDVTNGDLKYVTNASGLWIASTVDSTGNVGQYTSIDVDQNNKAHISYYDVTNGDLKYATNTTGSWALTTVDSTGIVGQKTSIAVDSLNKPHISYYDASTRTLEYAKESVGWTVTTVDSDSGTGYYTSIAIDSNNKAHIAYSDDGNYYLKYAENTSGSWALTTVDNSTDVAGYYTSIDLDSNNKAHISYFDDSYSDLLYATNASGSWSLTTVDSTGSVGYYTSLAVDTSNNKVHISYYDSTNTALKYATNTTGSWVITSDLDSSGEVGQNTSIAVDSNRNLHISYYDVTNSDLKYASNINGAWTLTTVDSTGNVGGYYTSIAVDTNNKAHIAYHDSTNTALKYATNASGSWVATTVDNTANMGQWPSIAIDTNNKAHISYVNSSPAYDLKYATNASGSWVKTDVDSGSSGTLYVVFGTSIALDSNNKAHISYFEWNAKALKYATNASGSWVKTAVDDTANSMGYYNSIAVDTSNNKVHISYYDQTNGDLKYATNATGSWVKSDVDTTGDVGLYPSIAVDTSNNKVHISYYDNTNGDLEYATNATGSWVYTTVDTTGNVGQFSSLAIDSNDKIHISYYDSTSGHLKYAASQKRRNTAGVLELDGTDDYVYSSTSSDLSISSNLTVESWIYKKSAGANDIGTTETLISKSGNYRLSLNWVTENSAHTVLELWPSSSGTPEVFTTTTPVTINDDGWYHFSASFNDSSNEVAVHIDGVDQGLSSDTFPYTLDTDTSQLTIGNTSSSNYFEGYIDDVRICSVTRYSSGSDFIPRDTSHLDSISGIAALYHFDQPSKWEDTCTLDSVTDTLTPSGNTVTLVNLSSFRAKAHRRKIVLKWVTDSETYNAGFNILRSGSKKGKYSKINAGIILPKGNDAIGGAEYRFIDKKVKQKHKYYYELEDVDLNGIKTIHKTSVKVKVNRKKHRWKK